MQLNSGAVNAPPWTSPNDWQEINHSLSGAIHRNPKTRDCLRTLAQRIAGDLTGLGLIMTDLCAKTCAHCPDPCCLGAKIWLDFRDLLFLHLMGLPIPPRQPILSYNDVCCYWSNKGCGLPRISRPWICTWYCCPAQKARIRRRPPAAAQGLDQMLQNIKADRRKLEALFLEMSA